jgi:hypothetical protein
MPQSERGDSQMVTAGCSVTADLTPRQQNETAEEAEDPRTEPVDMNAKWFHFNILS